MNGKEFAQKVRDRLQAVYHDRLRGVVLYGSLARGEAQEDSDIDLLILLRGPVDPWEDLRVIIKTLYDLQLEVIRPIHATPVGAEAFEAGEYSLYRNAKKEGIFT